MHAPAVCRLSINGMMLRPWCKPNSATKCMGVAPCSQCDGSTSLSFTSLAAALFDAMVLDLTMRRCAPDGVVSWAEASGIDSAHEVDLPGVDMSGESTGTPASRRLRVMCRKSCGSMHAPRTAAWSTLPLSLIHI